MTTKRFYRRRFLNRRGQHAGAYVIADCRIDTFNPKGGPRQYSIEAGVTIADCNRVANLDFHVYDEAAASNALHKARLLRDILVEFTDALEVAVDDWRDRERSPRQ